MVSIFYVGYKIVVSYSIDDNQYIKFLVINVFFYNPKILFKFTNHMESIKLNIYILIKNQFDI